MMIQYCAQKLYKTEMLHCSTFREFIVEEDDIIGWELKLFRGEESRNYSILVEVLDPAETEHPVPCGCQSAKCTLICALLDKENELMNEEFQ